MALGRMMRPVMPVARMIRWVMRSVAERNLEAGAAGVN